MTRLGAAAGLAGGLLFAGIAAVTATRAEGRPGAYRDTDDLGPYLLVAAVLFAIAAVAFYRSGLIRGNSGRAGVSLIGIGVAAVLGVLAYAVATGEFDSVWWVLFLGFLVILAGSVVTGAALAAARTIPAPAAYALIATTLLMFLFNAEDGRAWLGVPFGLAWSWVGLSVLRRFRGPAPAMA